MLILRRAALIVLLVALANIAAWAIVNRSIGELPWGVAFGPQ